jgi:hypothetical protein
LDERIWCGWLVNGHGVAHFFAIPLLAAPTTALVINDACARAAATIVVLHDQIFFNELRTSGRAAA